MKKIISISVIFFVLLHSCGVLYTRKVTCKSHIFKPEIFWFQGAEMNSYTLVNEITAKEKIFVLKDRWLSHRANYFTDTGCDCHDKSSQLLIANGDSIWTLADYQYLKNKKPQFRDAFTIKFGGFKWVFNNETSKIIDSSQMLNGVEVLTKTYIEVFEGKTYKLMVAEGIGILSIQLEDEIWNRKNPEKKPITTEENYRFMKNHCD